MSDDQTDSDGGRSVERRTVLRNVAVGAAGLGGLVGGASAASRGPDVESVVRTQGDLSPAEAIRKLRRAENFEFDVSPDAYTETRCGDGCSGVGTVEERTCYTNIPGCSDPCCDPWNDTGICC